MNAHMRDRIRAAIKLWLDETKKPRSLFAISVKADEFAKAFDKRRKRDLSENLYFYQNFVPSDWGQRWLKAANGTSDALLMRTPPGWKDGDSLNESLVLGDGKLTEAPLWERQQTPTK